MVMGINEMGSPQKWHSSCTVGGPTLPLPWLGSPLLLSHSPSLNPESFLCTKSWLSHLSLLQSSEIQTLLLWISQCKYVSVTHSFILFNFWTSSIVSPQKHTLTGIKRTWVVKTLGCELLKAGLIFIPASLAQCHVQSSLFLVYLRTPRRGDWMKLLLWNLISTNRKAKERVGLFFLH